jgi:hypothetical protein
MRSLAMEDRKSSKIPAKDGVAQSLIDDKVRDCPSIF